MNKARKPKNRNIMVLQNLSKQWHAYLAVIMLVIISITGLIIYVWHNNYLGKLGETLRNKTVEQTTKAGFVLENLDIKGNHYQTISEIKKVLGLSINKPILLYDLDQLRTKLENLAWVDTAHIIRKYPNTLEISILEKKPFALWQQNNILHLIDHKGTVIFANKSLNAFKQFSSLPLFVGQGAPENAQNLLNLLKNYPQLQKKFSALIRVSNRRWDLKIGKTLTVKLPEENIQKAFEKLDNLFKKNLINIAEVEIIDLRFNKKIILRFSKISPFFLKNSAKKI